MKLTQIILFLMLPLAALSPLLQPIDVELENEKSVNSAEKSSHLVVVNPNVHWTFSAGDFAIYNGSFMSEQIRSGMENSSDFDRAEVNWNTNFRVDLLGDAYCSFPAYIGQCHRLSISYQMNVTAYNDTDNLMLMMNMSIGDAVFIPTTYTGWEKGEESGHSRMWMKEQGGNEDMYRSTSWENSTSETYITGYKENITVGDIWSENEKEWSNWTSESNDEYNAGGGNWVPSTSNDAGSDFEEENETANATREVTIQSPGYNLADSSGSGPTSITGIEVEYWNDAGELDETVVLGEWGYPLVSFGGSLLSWKYVNGVWIDTDNDGVHDNDDDCENTPSPHTGLDEFGCSWEQRDDDGDGVLNPGDDCADTDSQGMTDIDANGCAWEQRDEDGDGILNHLDFCQGTPAGETVDTDGMTRGCSATQKDTDGDGVSDANDTCPGFNDTIDVDGDGISDGCDPLIDSDGDLVADADDLCEGHDDSIDVDDDGIPDGCDSLVDSDRDDVADADDQCPGYDDAIDVDEDGIIDGCDDIIDSDGDGVADSFEMCPGYDDAIDVDADGTPDGCDSIIDSDFDFVANGDDECPDTEATVVVNENGCSPAQLDTDSDGVNDAEDHCPVTPGGTHDADVDGCPDDTDSDGILDVDDACAGSSADEQVDTTGCVPDTGFLAGGFGGDNSILLGGLAALLVSIILLVSVMIVRRGKESEDYKQQSEIFEEVSASSIEWSGAGMPSRRPVEGAPMPTSGSPAESSSPHVAQVGEVQADGYEYLEHPPNSDDWWYRDQQTNHWQRWAK